MANQIKPHYKNLCTKKSNKGVSKRVEIRGRTTYNNHSYLQRPFLSDGKL
jgi:hypothetical protein